MTKLMMGVAISSLFAMVPAQAQTLTEKQKEQLLYQESLRMQQDGAAASPDQASPDQKGAIGMTKSNSGPGVQGFPDTRTGPATKSPEGSAEMKPSDPAASDSSSSGASSGESGSATTQPSQDSSGVQGFPDTRTGPATKAPDKVPEMDSNQ